MVDASKTAFEAINKIANIITPFLLTGGNLDLGLIDYSYNQYKPTAKRLARHLGVDSDDFIQSYAYYWSLLNLLSSTTYTSNEIYQQLANCETTQSFNELLHENNITLQDIKHNASNIDNDIDDDEDDDW